MQSMINKNLMDRGMMNSPATGRRPPRTRTEIRCRSAFQSRHDGMKTFRNSNLKNKNKVRTTSEIDAIITMTKPKSWLITNEMDVDITSTK